MIDGKVGIDGYDVEICHDFVSSGERGYRFLQGEWDVSECSATTLLLAVEMQRPLRAIPVLFERGPRQRNIERCEGKLKHPWEVKGNKFGSFRYGAAAAVWARVYLLDAYDIKTTDVEWFVSGREVYIGNALPVKVERINPPPFGQEKLQLSILLIEGMRTAPSCRATSVISACSAAAPPRR